MPVPAPQDQAETLSGTVQRIKFSAGDYYVLAVNLGKGQTETVTGNFHSVSVNDKLTATGQWTTHHRYGRQFAVETYRILLPSTEKGVAAYLGSGVIKGIGPKTAAAIVAQFGSSSLQTIRKNPEFLLQVHGIGEDRFQRIKESLKDQRDIEQIIITLQGYGVSAAYSVRIYKHFGKEAVSVLQSSPYALTKVKGIGFLVADKIAAKLGFGKNDPARLDAGLLYVLEQASTGGHVCLPRDVLIADAVKILQCEASDALRAILGLGESKAIECRTIFDRDYYYLPQLYASEKGIAAKLFTLKERISPLADTKKLDQLLKETESGFGFALAPQQRGAVLTGTSHPVMVITGGPGTGKTTITKAIVEICRRLKKNVLLAAPTGRAAKRLSEATGEEAQTIHRLLEFDPRVGGFSRNETNPLRADLLIVDEASMLDTYLAYQLLRAIRVGTSLILVGDIDQLPSVGPGKVLHDIIASHAVPVVQLDTIFRQAQGSLIVVNAHRINSGRMPLAKNPSGAPPDFFFLQEEDPEKVHSTILDLVSRRLPHAYGFDPIRDIQVLSPMRDGVLGVANLNQALQQSLNPDQAKGSLSHKGCSFHVRDKVMQVKNNYDKGVFNGETGIVTAVDTEDKTLTIGFDQGQVVYEHDELRECVLAYCSTIHKSQGSEYPVIVVPVHTQHYVMLQRNLIYTAITRGQRLVVAVGSKKALAIAVKNNRTPERHSHLRQLLES